MLILPVVLKVLQDDSIELRLIPLHVDLARLNAEDHVAIVAHRSRDQEVLRLFHLL